MTMQGRNWALAFLVGGAFLSAGPVPGTGAWRIGPGAFQEAKKAGKPPALAERYRKWLDEEVVYIISENEKDVFRSLRTDAERDNFIKMFWKRRDPTPETPVNEFREEHYRRIAFANDTYFEGKAGWRSDRGRVYIMFGPPDFFETNPGGGRGFLFGAQAPTAEFPSEVWTYREIPGLKTQESRVDFTFVNYYGAGSYQLTDNPALANALRNVSLPARYAGYNDYPSDGAMSPTEIAQMAQNAYKQPLQQLRLMAELTKSRGEVMEELERSSRLRKLKGIVESKASLSALSFFSRENYLRGADGLTYVPMVLEVAARDLEFRPAKDRYQGLVNFYIEVKDANGPIFQKSDRLEMSLKEESYRRRFTEKYQYLQGASLKPGRYFLHLVVWDELSGNVGYADRWIDVPDLASGDFGASAIILARDIRRVEAKPQGVVIDTKDLPAMQTLRGTDLKVPDKLNIAWPRGGPYTFGDLDVNPSTMSQYSGSDDLAYFYQIYNATFDEALGVARLRIEERIFKGNEPAAEIGDPGDIQVPIARRSEGGINRGNRFRLAGLAPGKYELVVRVRDVFSGKTAEMRAPFELK